jgi:hypothetical protein
MTNPALNPPNNAVSVKYILSLAAAVIALSAPPGIAELLVEFFLNIPARS